MNRNTANIPSQRETTMFRGNPEATFQRDVINNLRSNNVAFASEDLKTAFDIAVQGVYREMHASLFPTIEREVLSEEIELDPNSPRANVPITPDQRNHLVHERLKTRFEEIAETVALVISNYLSGSSDTVQDRQGNETVIISRQNFAQVSTLVAGLSHTVQNSEFNLLLNQITDDSTTLSPTLLTEVFNRISSMPAGSFIASLNAMNTQIINQHQVPSQLQNEPTMYSVTTLLALNLNQQRQLAEYAISQIPTNSEASIVVLQELVTTGQVPMRVIESLLLETAADSPDGAIYTDILSQITSYRQSTLASLQTTQRDFAIANEVAGLSGGDISNPALSGGQWARLAGYLYGVLAASVNLSAGIFSGDLAGAVAGAAPWAGLAIATGSNDPFEIPGRLSRHLAYNRGGREQMSEVERAENLARLTLYDPEAVDLFASDTFITILRDSLNLDIDNPKIDLTTFEARLRTTSPDIFNYYKLNYADQFRTNRPNLATNLTDIAFAYHHLEITNFDDYVNFATPKGFTREMLTNLG